MCKHISVYILGPQIYENFGRAQNAVAVAVTVTVAVAVRLLSLPLAKRKVVGHATTYLN